MLMDTPDWEIKQVKVAQGKYFTFSTESVQTYLQKWNYKKLVTKQILKCFEGAQNTVKVSETKPHLLQFIVLLPSDCYKYNRSCQSFEGIAAGLQRLLLPPPVYKAETKGY